MAFRTDIFFPGVLTVNLLDSIPQGNILNNAVRKFAILQFVDQLGKSGLPVETIQEAKLTINVNPGLVQGKQGDFISFGHMVNFLAQARMVGGKIFEKESKLFVAPHDPEKERRRFQCDWGTRLSK